MEIKWKNEYSVGIKEIDDQHKFFISLLNNLYSAIGSSGHQRELEQLFQKLSDYAENHFATEERYFDKFKYEGAEEHKFKHQEMRNEIKRIKERESENDIDFYGNIVYFLKEWLEDHLEKMDQKYKDCFMKHGLK